jgi:hypothetical protein
LYLVPIEGSNTLPTKDTPEIAERSPKRQKQAANYDYDTIEDVEGGNGGGVGSIGGVGGVGGGGDGGDRGDSSDAGFDLSVGAGMTGGERGEEYDYGDGDYGEGTAYGEDEKSGPEMHLFEEGDERDEDIGDNSIEGDETNIGTEQHTNDTKDTKTVINNTEDNKTNDTNATKDNNSAKDAQQTNPPKELRVPVKSLTDFSSYMFQDMDYTDKMMQMLQSIGMLTNNSLYSLSLMLINYVGITRCTTMQARFIPQIIYGNHILCQGPTGGIKI